MVFLTCVAVGVACVDLRPGVDLPIANGETNEGWVSE